MGGAIIFVAALAGLAIVSLVFVTYASHCFLHVLCDSSGGIDEVRWPSESIGEWWWKPLYCVGMLATWTINAGVVVGICCVGYPPAFVVALPVVLWAVFPLGLVSPLAAHNPFAIVYLPLLVRLARHAGATLTVLLVTLPLPAAAIGLVGLTLARASLLLGVAAAVVLPAALLFYARAWGRLVWFVLNEKRRERHKEHAVPAGSPALGVEDPWSLPEPEVPELDVEVISDEPEPEEVEDEWSPHKKPYAVLDEAKAEQEWRRRTRRAEPALEPGYDVTDDEPPPVPVESEKYRALQERALDSQARAERMSRREWAQALKPPTLRRALGRGLYGFLFYPNTLVAWMNLALLMYAVLLFACLALSFLPPV